MITQVDHVEVAPRMQDKTIAATYIGKEAETAEAASCVLKKDVAAAVVSESISFYKQFNTYIITAIFVICLLIVVYILCKYFTKGRNTNIVNGGKSDSKASESSQLKDPMTLIQNQDRSKYELDSEHEENDIKCPIQKAPKKLSLVDEEEDEDDEEEDGNDDGDDNEEEDEDDNEEDEEKRKGEDECHDVSAIYNSLERTVQ